MKAIVVLMAAVAVYSYVMIFTGVHLFFHMGLCIISSTIGGLALVALTLFED